MKIVRRATILTACRNTSKYLDECLSSLTMQTYQDWELIFIDDNSKDKSLKIAKKFAAADSRIHIFRNNEKKGCGATYNRALKLATGDICCVLDSDDALASATSLARVVEQYEERPDIGYIWTQFWLCTPALKKIKRGFSAHPGRLSLLDAGKLKKHCFSHWRTFRTRLRDDAEIFNPKLRACVDKWMGYVLEEIAKGGFFNRPLYKYRQRIGGLSFQGRRQWKDMKKKFTEKREKEKIKAKEIIVL